MYSAFTYAALTAVLPLVAAHWRLTNVTANGQLYQGANPYTNRPAPSVNWRIENGNFGFVDDVTSPNIACHVNAQPAALSVPVKAGDTITANWAIGFTHPEGTYLDYMARCPGDCAQADLSALSFFKISEAGLIPNPNVTSKDLYWTTAQLGVDNGARDIIIPPNLQAGNYILRTEIIAMHFARNPRGAQLYPTCINLEVSGSGTANPAGVPATQIYKADEPGLLVNVYWPRPTGYRPPGPPIPAGLFDSADANPGPVPSSSADPAPAPAPAPTTSSVAAPAPAPETTASAPPAPPAESAPASSTTRSRRRRPVASSSTTTTPVPAEPSTPPASSEEPVPIPPASTEAAEPSAPPAPAPTATEGPSSSSSSTCSTLTMTATVRANSRPLSSDEVGRPTTTLVTLTTTTTTTTAADASTAPASPVLPPAAGAPTMAPEPAPEQPTPEPTPEPTAAPKNPLVGVSIDQIIRWLQELMASGVF